MFSYKKNYAEEDDSSKPWNSIELSRKVPFLRYLRFNRPPRSDKMSNLLDQKENEKVALEGQNRSGHSSPPSVNSDEEFANPSGINEKALIRKLDFKLLPPLTLLYLLSFLDRSNSEFFRSLFY